MPKSVIPDAAELSTMRHIFAEQAAVLDGMFYRAANDGLSHGPRSRREMRKALKAQDYCRTSLKVLLALHAVSEDAKKISKSALGTNA
jgi:hypothetical protein